MNIIRINSEEEKEKKVDYVKKIIIQQMKISFELICGFLGSWDNLKIKKKTLK